MSDNSMNTDLSNRDLSRHVTPHWDASRESKVLSRLNTRRHQRRIRHALSLSAAAAIALATVTIYMWRIYAVDTRTSEEQTAQTDIPKTQVTGAGGRQVITLKDGSTATPLDDHSHLVIEDSTNRHAVIRITRGGGNFNVVPNRKRVFEVIHNDVSITVLGTVFTVQESDDQTHVAVTDGQVRVAWPGGVRVLYAGQADRFPPANETDTGVENTTDTGVTTKAAPRRNRTDSWRAMAQKGAYQQASELIRKGGSVQNTVADLLLAADAMRLSGHPEKALPYLRRIGQEHPSDPRASLAAFTRGRILLFQLNRPREAAVDFASARKLLPGSSLAEDALAREVEALSKSGNTALSKKRAEEYVDRYPNGRRLDAVRRYGNL